MVRRWLGGIFGNTLGSDTSVNNTTGIFSSAQQYYIRQEGGWEPPPFTATGGTIYTPGNGYKYHVFFNAAGISGGVFSVVEGYDQASSLEVLIVAAGGCSRGPYNGGAGAGGVIRTPFPISGDGVSYGINVGGTTSTRGNGADSTITGHPLGTLTAKGGGVGGVYPNAHSGVAGGSGGGSQDSPGTEGPGTQPAQNPAWTPLSGFNQYGNPGGDGQFVGAWQSGGGGGAGAPGGDSQGSQGSGAGGVGGVGVQMSGFEYPLIGLSPIDDEQNASSPTSNHYGGGGAGWGYAQQPNPVYFKAAGGGGVGAGGAPSPYTIAGIDGLGGGGGAGPPSAHIGGSGIIVFRFQP
jgi:hypothetical protein